MGLMHKTNHAFYIQCTWWCHQPVWACDRPDANTSKSSQLSWQLFTLILAMQKFNTLKLMRKWSNADTKKKPVLHPVQGFQASAINLKETSVMTIGHVQNNCSQVCCLWVFLSYYTYSTFTKLWQSWSVPLCRVPCFHASRECVEALNRSCGSNLG